MKLDVRFPAADGGFTTEHVEIEGRLTHDFMAADAKLVLQIGKIVVDRMGEPQGMMAGDGDTLFSFVYGSRGKVEFREANPDNKNTYRKLPPGWCHSI